MPLLIVTIVLFLVYSILIVYYWRSWNSIPAWSAADNTSKTMISVIIPARNEEEKIGRLLQALKTQSYPKEFFEVIVVDDHSTDKTPDIVTKSGNATLITLRSDAINSYKKKAIEAGITAATGELIVTTDADCVPHEKWLQTIASFRKKNNSVLVVAPVCFDNTSSVLSVFQTLDFLTLQGITGASVYKNIHAMCNGANLAYERTAFYDVNGFTGIDTIASGDDMLLMHKIWKQYPSRVHYLKSREAIVTTQPMPTWKTFFNQRIRWASKAGKYDDKRIFLALLLVYLFNLCFPALFIAGFWNWKFFIWCTGLWIIKTMIEFPFVHNVACFFGKKYLMKYFFFFQPLHIFYTLLSGLFGQFGKYEWKGRMVR
jgi:biofilm PGA synthesis N-glycosyltransferase PgaC